MTIKVEWIDRGRDPKEPPDPRYPDGIDVDSSNGAKVTCLVPLKHPTPRCGLYVVTCTTCGNKVVITTAGRPDDPRSLKLECLKKDAHQ